MRDVFFGCVAASFFISFYSFITEKEQNQEKKLTMLHQIQKQSNITNLTVKG